MSPPPPSPPLALLGVPGATALLQAARVRTFAPASARAGVVPTSPGSLALPPGLRLHRSVSQAGARLPAKALGLSGACRGRGRPALRSRADRPGPGTLAGPAPPRPRLPPPGGSRASTLGAGRES